MASNVESISDNKVRGGASGPLDWQTENKERPSGCCPQCLHPMFFNPAFWKGVETTMLTCHKCGLQAPGSDFEGVPHEDYALAHEIPIGS